MGLGASVAAGVVLDAGTLPQSSNALALGGTPTTAAAATAATGTIKDVQHVVILMQENRSFDHYFGRLKGVRCFDDRSGITLSGGYPVFNQPNGTGRPYP
ncbi:alkaline phosphatase family protein [Streptomyces sp. NPDC001450]